MTSRLSPPRQLDVIEIGCGSGSMAARIAGFGYGGTYLGIDIQDRFRRDQPLAGLPYRQQFLKAAGA